MRALHLYRFAALVVSANLLMQPAVANSGHDGKRGGEDHKLSVTVSFGAGLNTAQPRNPANHHILPPEIRVAKGGVVNFVVSGFHQIMVYHPGVGPGDIALPPADKLFINYSNNLFYRGITPAGGPPPSNPATIEPSNASNRVESVSFPEKGIYLVICNVRPHFLDGMIAIVHVK